MSPRWVSLAVLLVACGREAPPSAQPAASAPLASASAPPSAEPVASASSEPADASAPRARSPRPTPDLVARVLRLEPEKSVALAGPNRELVLRGIDGKALGWKVGDEIVVYGTKPDAGVIDCTEPSHCSVGLKSGGDVALFGVDAHSAMNLFSSFRQNAIVVGKSREAWVELRATNNDMLARGFAAAFGLAFKAHKSFAVLAPPAVIGALAPKHVPVPSRKVDLQLTGAELGNLTRLFSDISKRTLSGEVRGNVSILARDVDSSEALDAVFALCGVSFARKGAEVSLSQNGDACSQYTFPDRHCPPATTPSMHAVLAGLGCIDVKQLEVKALALPPGSDTVARALLGQGPPRLDDLPVRTGEFLSHSVQRNGPSGVHETNWRIGTIGRDGVELVLEDPGDPDRPAERLKLAVP